MNTDECSFKMRDDSRQVVVLNRVTRSEWTRLESSGANDPCPKEWYGQQLATSRCSCLMCTKTWTGRLQIFCNLY